jgi:hypothetical protein
MEAVNDHDPPPRPPDDTVTASSGREQPLQQQPASTSNEKRPTTDYCSDRHDDAAAADAVDNDKNDDNHDAPAGDAGGGHIGAAGGTAFLDSATFVPRGQFLPDIDDAAMSQVTKYMILYEQDLIWSFVSDGIFLLGGILYVILSLFDFWTTTLSTSILAMQAYNVLQVLAPLVYLLNSFVDIRWTSAARRRIKDKRLLIDSLEGWRSYRCCDEETISSIDTNCTKNSNMSANNNHRQTMMICSSSNSSSNNTFPSWLSSMLHRLRKHAAHRRSTLAALTFGIAATLGFLAVVTDIYVHSSQHDDGAAAAAATARFDRLARILDSWQNYFYIISASICISGKRTQPWMGYMVCDNGTTHKWLCNPDTLEDLGDLLFLIGSVIDTVLTELSLNDPIAPLLSSILWMADSCLYLRGDFIIASNQASPLSDKDSLLV